MPVTPTGITGTRASNAIRATPVLPRYSRPSGERVPSGNSITSPPAPSASTAALIAAMDAEPPSRFTGTHPAHVKNHRVYQWSQ